MIALTELADRVGKLAGRRDGRVVVGIVGPPGAGKSTLALALQQRLGGGAALLPMDGFHLAHGMLESLGLAARKGAPETFDADGFVALLRRIRDDSAQTVYAPTFDRTIEEPVAGAIAIAPEHRVILVEGNYLLLDEPGWRDVPALVDELWYLAPAPELRRSRLVARHRKFGKSADAAAAWVHEVDERNARLVEEGRARADLVIEDWA